MAVENGGATGVCSLSVITVACSGLSANLSLEEYSLIVLMRVTFSGTVYYAMEILSSTTSTIHKKWVMWDSLRGVKSILPGNRNLYNELMHVFTRLYYSQIASFCLRGEFP